MSVQIWSYIKPTETQWRESFVTLFRTEASYREQPLLAVDNDICASLLRFFCKHQLWYRKTKK